TALAQWARFPTQPASELGGVGAAQSRRWNSTEPGHPKETAFSSWGLSERARTGFPLLHGWRRERGSGRNGGRPSFTPLLRSFSPDVSDLNFRPGVAFRPSLAAFNLPIWPS